MTADAPAGLFLAEDGLLRCRWCAGSPAYRHYHDNEWGFPVTDERRLFEKICLEGFQAGLSWLTILRKREAYRLAFDGFDVERIARYDARRVEKLLANPGIVRNRLKITSTLKNARAFLKVQEQFGSFARYQWQFIGGEPLTNRHRAASQVPPRTDLSDALSRELKKRGFSFVGSTIMYAYMQAVGMVNDHLVGCFRHPAVHQLEAGVARGAPTSLQQP